MRSVATVGQCEECGYCRAVCGVWIQSDSVRSVVTVRQCVRSVATVGQCEECGYSQAVCEECGYSRAV